MSNTPAKKKLVCFCGAGFSAPSGLPTMANFSHAVRKCETLTEIERRDFDAVQIACSALTAMSNASSRNLEDLASLLSVLDLSRPDFSFPGCEATRSPRDAIRLLAKCIQETCNPRSHNYSSSVHNFINKDMTSRCEMWLITTNYDMTIELAGASNNLRINMSEVVKAACHRRYVELPPAGRTVSIYSSQLSRDDRVMAINGEMHLRKLHGSVNWFRSSTGDLIVEDGWTNRESGPHGFKLSLVDEHWNEHLVQDRCLVLPSEDKREAIRLLAQEWQDASKALASADAIWFIGYSFPQSDSFMRHFLAGALRENTRVRQILIIDPQANEIRLRTRHLFAAPEMRELVQPLPFRFENISGRYSSLLEDRWDICSTDIEVRDLLNRQRGRQIIHGDTHSELVDENSPNQRGWRGRGWPR